MNSTGVHRDPDEAGLSLVELIIVVVLVGVLSGVIVMILVNSWNTQKSVNSTTEATNEGQVYASSIERAVRNATAMTVAGAELHVRTTLGGAKTCQAFKIAAAVSPAPGDAAFLTMGSAAPAWAGPMIVANLSPTGGTYFSADPDDPKTVIYGFAIATDSSPVKFQGTVSARNTLEAGIAPC